MLSTAGRDGPLGLLCDVQRGRCRVRLWWVVARCWVLKKSNVFFVVCVAAGGCWVVSVVLAASNRLGCVLLGVGGGLVGVRSFFENCTVDASIFVVKLVRAHGGCLGTRSR